MINLNLFEKCVDASMRLLDGKRGCAAFECGDEVLAENIATRCIVRDFLNGVLGVVRVAHEAEVLPDDFFTGANVEAGEVWIERSPAFDACRVFVAVWDVCAC